VISHIHTYINIIKYIYIVSWFPGPWYSRFFPVSVAPYSSLIDQSSPTLRSRPPLWCEQCGAPACCGANGKVEILGDFHGKTMIRTHAIWWFIYIYIYTFHCLHHSLFFCYILKKGQRCCHYHTAPVFDGRRSDTDDQFTQLWMEKTRWIITLW